MAQTREEKREYLRGWRLANKQRIYEYNKAHVEAKGSEHAAMRAAYREKNRDVINQAARDYYSLHVTSRLQYAKAYRLALPDKVAAASRQWREQNPEKQKAAVERWREANPDADTVHRNLRRVRKKQIEGRLSPGIVARLFDAQAGRCVYCNADLKDGKHLDHKTPLSRGGSNTDQNVHLTCPTCNLRKHAKTHEEFLAWHR